VCSEDLTLLEEAHTDILPHSRNMRTSVMRLYFGYLIPLFHVRLRFPLLPPSSLLVLPAGLGARTYAAMVVCADQEHPDLFSPQVHTCDELMWAFATV
jgi:hypothetical protein